jgi:hypothetical protein
LTRKRADGTINVLLSALTWLCKDVGMPRNDRDMEKSTEWASAAASIVGVIAALVAVFGVVFSLLASSLAGRSTTTTIEIPSGVWFGLGAAILLGLLVLVLRETVSARRSAAAQEKAERALQGVAGPDDLLGFIRANASQMHAYDLMARRQAAQSHRASLVAMFVGLALVGAGVAVAVLAPDTASKVVGAAVTSVGAAVGGYIARTFLTNSRRSADNAAYYFQQPLVTSYLLGAERLLSRLPEDARASALQNIIGATLDQASAASGTALAPPGNRDGS